jgi:NitT/TauT family transport system substrate-binding protein
MDDIGPYQALAFGKVDFNAGMVGELVARIDAGDPIVILAGTHAGCFELFGTDRVRSVKDLKGKTVAVPGLGTSHHFFVASIAAYVGLDPGKDITFVTLPLGETIQLFADGKIDAIFDFPPVPQELRARKIGHVVIDGRVDRPWSQYFCCMLAAHREFVQKYPAATKRAVRAIMKANDVCTREPERVAQLLVDKGYTPRYDYAVQALKELPYSKWREYNPDDTVRFYALRLREAGMIKSSPQKIFAQGTDWRFLNELKRRVEGIGRSHHARAHLRDRPAMTTPFRADDSIDDKALRAETRYLVETARVHGARGDRESTGEGTPSPPTRCAASRRPSAKRCGDGYRSSPGSSPIARASAVERGLAVKDPGVAALQVTPSTICSALTTTRWCATSTPSPAARAAHHHLQRRSVDVPLAPVAGSDHS